MSTNNVIQFTPRKKVEQPVPAAVRPETEEQIEASVLVMLALGFYARQGYDGGEKARKAIAAMQRELMEPSQA